MTASGAGEDGAEEAAAEPTGTEACDVPHDELTHAVEGATDAATDEEETEGEEDAATPSCRTPLRNRCALATLGDARTGARTHGLPYST